MPVLLDQQGSVMRIFNPRAQLPFSVYIDKNGGVAATHDGFASGDEPKIKEIVTKLLSENGNQSASAGAPTKAVPSPKKTN